MKAAGGNPRDLKVVVFKGSAEAITAMLGGHLDAVVIGATNATVHIGSGRMRILGVAAPQRLAEALARRADVARAGRGSRLRGLAGDHGRQGNRRRPGRFLGAGAPEGLSHAGMEDGPRRNYWTSDFKPSAAFAKELEKDYAETRTVLTDAGLVK